MATASLAQQIIDKIFTERHRRGLQEVTFTRDDLISAADALGEPRPKNLGDIVYSLRYRVPLPDSIRRTAPPGREWAIFPGGNAVYTLRTVPFNLIEPRNGLRTIREKFPDLIARPVAAQFMEQSVIAIFEFQESNKQITIAREQHYSLVPPEELDSTELAAYRSASQRDTT